MQSPVTLRVPWLVQHFQNAVARDRGEDRPVTGPPSELVRSLADPLDELARGGQPRTYEGSCHRMRQLHV
jgi:hypothetical protein